VRTLTPSVVFPPSKLPLLAPLQPRLPFFDRDGPSSLSTPRSCLFIIYDSFPPQSLLSQLSIRRVFRRYCQLQNIEMTTSGTFLPPLSPPQNESFLSDPPMRKLYLGSSSVLGSFPRIPLPIACPFGGLYFNGFANPGFWRCYSAF